MKTEQNEVTVKVKKGGAVVEEVKIPYEKVTYESFAEAVTALTEEKALVALNYGADLKVKAAIRQKYTASIEDPDKSYRQAAKKLSGLPGWNKLSEEQIIEKLKAEEEDAA